MPTLVLCDNGDLPAILPLAKRQRLGVELQAFYDPALLDAPAAAVASHRALLASVAGPRALHGPFADLAPGSFDPLVRQLAAQRIGQGLAIAAQLGVRHVVLHHGYVPNTSAPVKWVARSAAFWGELLATLPAGLQLHLENLLEEGPAMLLELAQRVGDSRLGICLDLGHAHLSKTPVLAWVRELGPQVTYVHLHDNLGDRDAHLPLGRGNLPLGDALAALADAAPGAIWALEADAPPSLRWLEVNGFARVLRP